jgi:hypothetical protein
MLAKDAAANGAGTTAAKNGSQTTNGFAENTQNTQGATGAAAKAALQQKAANAKAVADKAGDCVKNVMKACKNLAPADQKVADHIKDTCQELATASSAVATDKAASSGGMGDMSQLASALGQALGPLAQMMGQQQPTDPGITDPSDYSTPPTPVAGTSLGNANNPLAGTNIGNGSTTPNGAEFKPTKNNITGFTPVAGSTMGFGPSDAYGTTGGTGYGDSGGAAIGSGSYSAGSSGGLNSSGSSMAPGSSDAEKAAAAAEAAENYEVNAGGGGGSRPAFLGLKSRTDDEIGSGDSVLGDLGISEEGARDLASNDEMAGGIGEAEGNTLFHVVHSKIAEIKKRGSI